MYFEIDDNDSVTVEFKTKDTSTAKWDVMASQIECSSIYRSEKNSENLIKHILLYGLI